MGYKLYRKMNRISNAFNAYAYWRSLVYAQSNPVLPYTGRLDRIDNFWFTIAHEIWHILKDLHDESDLFVDSFNDIDMTSFWKASSLLAMINSADSLRSSCFVLGKEANCSAWLPSLSIKSPSFWSIFDFSGCSVVTIYKDVFTKA